MFVELFSAHQSPAPDPADGNCPVTSAEGLVCAQLQEPRASRRPSRARPSPSARLHTRNSLTNFCHRDTSPAACTLTHAAPLRSPLLPLGTSTAVLW